jgi:magnesium chelatase family protein
VGLRRGGVANARLEGARLRSTCRLTQHDEALVASVSAAAGLSARGVGRLLRVARTIADLDGARNVGHEHLEEAARYRVPSGPYAGQLAG